MQYTVYSAQKDEKENTPGKKTGLKFENIEQKDLRMRKR
jgi:hypothetical protein